jgi:hypothetical protein
MNARVSAVVALAAKVWRLRMRNLPDLSVDFEKVLPFRLFSQPSG